MVRYSKTDIEKAKKLQLEPSFVFTAENVASEIISKHPNLEVCHFVSGLPRK